MSSELRAEMSRAASLALPVWVEARANNDFASFLPALRENVELRRRYIACFDGDYPEPYDAVLDDFERGMTTAEVRSLFDYLKEHQAPLVKLVAGSQLPEPPHERSFPLELQKQFELEVVRRFGYDDDAWRIDPTVHPFASGTGRDDIRITTRYFPHNLDGLFATMHETGHGLYEHQVAPSLERTPLGSGTSLGMHESQSRMWENLVGRSLPAWRFFFPKLQQTFPDALAGYDVDRWYREINAVQPSLIRVEADEATYNLHIILRFELEQELIDESFPLESLPEEWNRRMYDLLGVEVPGRHPRRPPGHPLGDRRDRLFRHLRAREPDLGPALGAHHDRSARPRGRLRARRVHPAPRMATRSRPPVRPEVHAGRNARARDRNEDDRPGAIYRLFAAENGGHLRSSGTHQLAAVGSCWRDFATLTKVRAPWRISR